jgi:hypothetical protein
MMNTFEVENIQAINTDAVLNALFNNIRHWQLRSASYPFYTLGMNSYMDTKSGAYHNQYKYYNDILGDNFADLYKVVLSHLSKRLGEPVVLAYDLAWPGFHIFEADERFDGIRAPWHIDVPQVQLNVYGKDNSTVTVAIKIPASGAGIDWLDDNYIHHLPYKEKDLVWHNGLTVHRIAGFREIVKGEYRITLQGHLIRRDNVMEFYW